MKRAALVVLLVGLPLALLLFPAFRRAVLGRARLLLLVLSGAILAAGVARLLGAGPPLAPAELAFSVVGVVLLLLAIAQVVLEGRRR